MMHRTTLVAIVLSAGLAAPVFAQSLSPTAPTAPAPTKQPPVKQVPVKQVPTKEAPAPGQLSPTAPVKPQIPTKDQLSPGKPATPVVPASEGGAMTFETINKELGVISDDKVMDTEFKFKNTGTGPLTIVDMKGSCGCTVPALEKKVYQPNEEGAIKVQFNPNHKRGAQHTTVTVTANDASKPANQVVLTLTSEVRPMVMAEPQSLAMGQAIKGQGKKMTVTVTSRQKDITVQSATATVAMLDTKVLPAIETEINGERVWQYPVEVSVLPTSPVGTISGSVAVRTSDPGRIVNFVVQGEIIGDVTVNPQRVQLLGLAPGQDFSQTLNLKSRVGKPFRVLKIEEQTTAGPSGMFKDLSYTLDNSVNPPAYNLTVSGKASNQGGMVSGFIVVTTDLPDEKEVKIPFSGYVRVNTPAKPVMETKPASVWDTNPSSLIPQ